MRLRFYFTIARSLYCLLGAFVAPALVLVQHCTCVGIYDACSGLSSLMSSKYTHLVAIRRGLPSTSHTRTHAHRSPPTHTHAVPPLPFFVRTQFACIGFYDSASINDDCECQSFYSFTICWTDLGFGLLNFDLELSYLHTWRGRREILVRFELWNNIVLVLRNYNTWSNI